MKLSKRIKQALSYKGNLGFEEMMLFYRQATPEQQETLEDLLNKDPNQALNFLQDSLNLKLQPL